MVAGAAAQSIEIQIRELEREEFKLEHKVLKAIESRKIPRRFVIPTDYEINQPGHGDPTKGAQFIKMGSDGRPRFPDYPIRVSKPYLCDENGNPKIDEIHFDERNAIGAGLQKYLNMVRRLEVVREEKKELCSRVPKPAQDEAHAPTKELFTHSPDYGTVVIRGSPFSLTSSQARVIQFLYEQWKRGTPSVSKHYLAEEILETQSQNFRLRDIFRSTPRSFEALIKTHGEGMKRGHVSLNLP